MSDKYYVYMYLRVDNTPYYVGKGKDNRAWKSHRRSNGTDLLPKDKTRIVIFRDNLTEQEAFIIEKKLITEYGRVNNNTGILHNLSDGGGPGCNGYRHDEQKIDMIKSSAKINAKKRINSGTHNFQNQVHPNLGGKITEKLIISGKHNLLKRADGTSVSSDRVANGTHHFLNDDWKKKNAAKTSKRLNEQVANGEALFVKCNPSKIKVNCIKCKKETNLMGLSRFHKHTKEYK